MPRCASRGDAPASWKGRRDAAGFRAGRARAERSRRYRWHPLRPARHSAAMDVVRDPAPECQRLGERKRMHEAHRCAAFDAIHQHLRKAVQLGVGQFGQPPDSIRFARALFIGSSPVIGLAHDDDRITRRSAACGCGRRSGDRGRMRGSHPYAVRANRHRPSHRCPPRAPISADARIRRARRSHRPPEPRAETRPPRFGSAKQSRLATRFA